ncbi:MAG: sigma-54 dependent transcriptional regulator [Gemmatimonadales bacterium]
MRIEAPEVDEFLDDERPDETDDLAVYALGPQDRASVRVLVIDDEASIRESCESVLKAEGYVCDVDGRAEDALRRLKGQPYDIVMIDQNMPVVHGLDILAEVRQRNLTTLPIMMTGNATMESSIRAMQAGAFEYLPKPFTATQLLVVIGRAAYQLLKVRQLSGSSTQDGILVDRGDLKILGVSKPMREAVRLAMKAARTDASVFLTGGSGTGKEVIAQLIHKESRRSRKALVAINCAALPAELLESEMFGHRRGAFTGAVRDKAGLLEVADQGTFFLDELGEMPLPLQAKLLRVLQDGVVRRVGSERDDAVVDVRFIAATNRDPETALFFLEHFWRRHQLPGRTPPRLAPETMDALVRYEWPGNVRELQNVLENLVVLSDPDELIGPERLSILEMGQSATTEDGSGDGGASFARVADYTAPFHEAKDALVARFEREYLARMIARTGGNMSEAARQAGIDRTTLYRLMEKHELSRGAFVS